MNLKKQTETKLRKTELVGRAGIGLVWYKGKNIDDRTNKFSLIDTKSLINKIEPI